MLNLEHDFISYLVNHPDFGDKFACQSGSPIGPHWRLDLDMFKLFRCRAAMTGVLGHPQWRQLLTMHEEIYHELCVEFYSTFSHIVPASKKSRSRVEFMLGGQPLVLTYNAFAQAIGLNTDHITMMERQYTVDFNYQGAFRALCRQEHEQDEFEGSRTNAVRLKTQWRILHTLLTRSVVPNLQSGHLMTNRGLIALYSMRSSAELIHLGSLIATSFARCLGQNRVDTMHMRGIITRIARHFRVDLARYTRLKRTESFPVETL
ncbi:unnamed protein product [Linum trigynum]|uniref:Uncharacterized protein n=1 Tax=Linum trigynum TaxID=586398 RepID=A0AAV2CVR1_9ROSI